MNILIDCSNLKVGGGIQVATSFLNDLHCLDLQNDELISDMDFLIVLSQQMSNNFDKSIFSDKFHFIDLPENISKSKIKSSFYIKRIEKIYDIFKVFCIFGPSYNKSRIQKVVGFAIAHYIYKESPYIQKLKLKEKIKLEFLRFIKVFLFKKNSDYLIFETENAKSRFCDIYKYDINKTAVVSNTINEIFNDKNKWNEKMYNFTSTYNFFVLSANYPHKNIQIIPKVIDILINTYNLRNFKFIISLNKNDLKFHDRYDKYIDYLGFVKLQDLPNLYEAADLLFMPTLLECFSTTYLEAMFMKVPIVASDMSFAKDICGDGALYYDSTSAEDAASNINLLLNNQKLISELKNKGTDNLKRFGSSMDRTYSYIKILKNI